MSDKAIVVNSKGKGASATVTEKAKVKLASTAEIDDVIGTGLMEVANILSGEVEDPTKKRCSRCLKKGRYPFHDINQFSLLKNGKRLSQCKVCRTEQSVEWEQRAAHRKQYHKDYQLIRQPVNRVPNELKEFVESMTAEEEAEAINGGQALFVAMPQDDIEVTE